MSARPTLPSRVLASPEPTPATQTVRCTCGGWLRQGVNFYGASIEWCSSCDHRVVLTGRVAPQRVTVTPEPPDPDAPVCAREGCEERVTRDRRYHADADRWRLYCSDECNAKAWRAREAA